MLLCVVSEKNRTSLGIAHRSRIGRPFVSTLLVSFLLLTQLPIPPHFSSRPARIDPRCALTDGTTNFVHGFPYACISLGLIDQRVPILGVIYNPFLEHLYTGVRGAGSFLHTHTPASLGTDTGTATSTIGVPQRLPLAPASARPLPSLAGALIGVGWGSDRGQEPLRREADSFSRLAAAPPHGVMAHSLRSIGSAALNIALVAQGALDVYWCVSFFPSPSPLIFSLVAGLPLSLRL